MKTFYACEVCGRSSTSAQLIEECEARCRKNAAVLEELDKIFGNDEWSPPYLINFQKWNPGDRIEMAQKILRLKDFLKNLPD